MGVKIISKKRKLSLIQLSLIVLFFLIVNSIGVIAQEKENYVGIDEGDEFIWSVSYDEDGIEEWYEDEGINTTLMEVDEDIEAIKMVVVKIDEEDEHDGDEGVKITYDYYETKDRSADDWKLEEENEKDIIYQFTYETSVISFYQYCAFWGVYLVADNVDWEYVMNDLDEDLDEDGSASASGNTNYIHIYEDSLSYGNTSYQIEDIYITCEYNSDGVLQSYRFEYYDDTLVEATLEWSVFNELWIYLVIGIFAAIAIIIIIAVVYTITKKPKEKLPFVRPEIKKQEITQEQKAIDIKEQQKVVYCPYCGSPITSDAIYCEFCGKRIED